MKCDQVVYKIGLYYYLRTHTILHIYILYKCVCAHVYLFCKNEEGSPSRVLQGFLESDEFADISSRITSRGIICYVYLATIIIMFYLIRNTAFKTNTAYWVFYEEIRRTRVCRQLDQICKGN